MPPPVFVVVIIIISDSLYSHLYKFTKLVGGGGGGGEVNVVCNVSL